MNLCNLYSCGMLSLHMAWQMDAYNRQPLFWCMCRFMAFVDRQSERHQANVL